MGIGFGEEIEIRFCHLGAGLGLGLNGLSASDSDAHRPAHGMDAPLLRAGVLLPASCILAEGWAPQRRRAGGGRRGARGARRRQETRGSRPGLPRGWLRQTYGTSNSPRQSCLGISSI